MQNQIDWGNVVAAIVALGAALVAWIAYKSTQRGEHTKLLVELFDRFYGRADYRDVFQAFDGSHPAKLGELRAAMQTGAADGGSTMRDAEWQLTTYLNFLEMVAALAKLGRLTRADVATVFYYPLERLRADQDAMRYLSSNSYLRLKELLEGDTWLAGQKR